jgi:Rho guanine nucleotide exchange factor 17
MIFFIVFAFSSGTQNMSIVFSKPSKRSHWEEIFTEAKQKLIASVERFQVPEFIASVPIRKTRAGLQFTCAASTLGAQKDVWVCNSDGYVGQVCVLSLNQPEPTVTSCNGVCNARILCVTSVPGYSDPSNNTNNLNSSISLLSISNSSTVSNKTTSTKSAQSGSNIQLDSSSSSDSEPETALDRSVSPSVMSNASQIPPCDETESQMWLGTEDGYIHVYNCSDNIRIKKNKIKIQHVSAVTSILYLDNRIFVSLANGDICVYIRESSSWNTNSPIILSIGSATSPVTKLLNVYGKLWCSIQGVIKILNTSTLQVGST